MVTYVDDFLILAPDAFLDKVNGAIESKWRITEKPTVHYGSGISVEYLSVNITAVKDGFFLEQSVYTQDLLAKWSMAECRSIGSLEDPTGDVEEDDEPDAEDVHTVQRLAGGLNWLATRTRPDIAFIVSQLASAATKQPKRAIALGKRTLRYLAGTRDHGIMMDARGRLDVGTCSSSLSREWVLTGDRGLWRCLLRGGLGSDGRAGEVPQHAHRMEEHETATGPEIDRRRRAHNNGLRPPVLGGIHCRCA